MVFVSACPCEELLERYIFDEEKKYKTPRYLLYLCFGLDMSVFIPLININSMPKYVAAASVLL